MIESIIEEYVINVCSEPANMFTRSFYADHLLVVLKYSELLADTLKADKEIVRLSSLLHDISAVMDIKTLPAHNINSADMAELLLRQNNYPEERIQMVKQTILKHTSPIKIGEGTPEEICLSNADAISQIVKPAYWMYFVFKIRNLTYEEGKNWLITKIDSNWNSLIEPAKALIEKEYKLVKETLNI
jgi:uncharacterized protein